MIKINIKKQMKTALGEQKLEINFDIDKGEFITLFGESGAGKTTILRIIAGLTVPEEGYIEVNNEVWFDSTRNFSLPVQERKIGFVFQDHRLFPNMTIMENLEYALSGKKEESSIREWIEIMDLKELKDERPDKLSGGQKQRAALACALVSQPKILLLDEPLSALDINLRLKMQDEIIKVYQKTKITTILVSHDLSEVFKLSGKIFVIENGKIIRSGKPDDIFVNGNISGKFKFTGEILDISKDGVINILTIRIGNNITKVVATDEEIINFKIGSKIAVAAKAFNPLILAAEF